jgi:GcrA cell cycle regulator
MKPDTDWTPTLTAKLRRLFDQGLSFSHIASELAMSRNAIMGKCNRLGLRRLTIPQTRARSAREAHLQTRLKKRPKQDPRRNTQAQKIQAGPKINLEALPSTPPSDLEIPRRRRRNIWNLGPKHCRFIVGDPATPDHFYCGARRLPTLPYCADHARRCFHPAKSGLG